MKVELKENEIGVVFLKNGFTAFSRGVLDTENFADIREVYIIKDSTPVYQLSNYWGYAKVPEDWKEIKPC